MFGTMRRLLTKASLSLGDDKSAVANRFLRVFSVDALVKASGVLLLPLYLALMTQEEYATFNYLTSAIGVLALVCNFGLYIPQSKIFHDVSESERGTLLLTINLLLFGLLTALLLPTYILGWDGTLVRFLFSNSIDYERYRYLIPIGVAVAVYSQMTLNYFLTREQIKSVQRFNISKLIIGTTFTLSALYWINGDQAEVRLYASLAAELSILAAFMHFYLREMRGIPSIDLAKKSLSLGLPIMISAVLGIVINFGDKYFIEKFCSLADLSVYFLGLTFASIISVVFMAFQNVWLPIFLKEKDLAKNIMKTRLMARNLLVLLSLLAVAIWLFVACAFAFGIIDEAYIQVLGILPILMVASICSSLVGLMSVYTVYWAMTHITIVIGGAIAVISVPMNYLAVKDFGIHGIASVSVLLNILYGGAYFLFIRFRANALMVCSK